MDNIYLPRAVDPINDFHNIVIDELIFFDNEDYESLWEKLQFYHVMHSSYFNMHLYLLQSGSTLNFIHYKPKP